MKTPGAGGVASVSANPYTLLNGTTGATAGQYDLISGVTAAVSQNPAITPVETWHLQIVTATLQRSAGAAAGTVRAVILSDNAGTPDAVLGTSAAIELSSLPISTTQQVSFPFTPPVVTTADFHVALYYEGGPTSSIPLWEQCGAPITDAAWYAATTAGPWTAQHTASQPRYGVWGFATL